MQLLPREAKRRMEHLSSVLAFQGSAQGAGFCPAGLRALAGNQYTVDGWGQMARRELGIWCSSREPQTASYRSQHSRKWSGGSASLWLSPWQGKRRLCTQRSRFLGGFLKDWFLSYLTPSADGTGILWMPGSYRAKQSSAAPFSTGEPSEPRTAIRDSARLQGPEK